MDFYEYLKTQFTNIDEAKIFYKKWRDEWEQNIPGHPEWSNDGGFSQRAMAGHISAVLTGEDYESMNSYIDTKYGSEIYFSGYD